MTSGKTPEALREMRAILERHPEDPETEYEIGVLLQDLAGATFERIIRVAPDSAEGRELLGKYHEARGQLPEALSEYRSALSRSPDRTGLHYLVGNILWKLRDYDAAIPELEAELRINPAHSMANHRIGSILIARDRAPAAIPYLEQAIRGAPSSLDLHRDLGKAYRIAGRLNDALRELELVATSRPDDELVHAQLALVHRAMGNPAKASAELGIHRELLRKRSEAARTASEQAGAKTGSDRTAPP